MAYPRLILLLTLCLLTGCSNGNSAKLPTSQHVTLGGRSFNLELALDGASCVQGLSDRSEIAPDGGMLFVLPRAQMMEFVMRRCPVPIDLIFLGPNARIVQMHRMTPQTMDTPEDQLKRYPSRWPAQFAIELKGGTLDELALETGQKVALPVDDLKKLAR